jgi:hypothetical protein
MGDHFATACVIHAMLAIFLHVETIDLNAGSGCGICTECHNIQQTALLIKSFQGALSHQSISQSFLEE